MFWWLPKRRARIKSLAAEAEALICVLGVDAYAEARRKEHEASSDTIARDWARVAMVVAKRTGLDLVHRAIRDADVELENESVASWELRSSFEPSPLDHLNSFVSARPRQFRVQFVGAAHGREPRLLKEVGIEAADVSAAVITAASLALPPKTNGLHILDREGRVVFARDRTNPRLQSLSWPERQLALSGARRWGLSQWRRAVKTKHLFLSYVHNVRTGRREQAIRSTPGGTSSVTS